ncbi:MAG: hypothetical protein IPG90_05685 [Bacteroidetes bacterium]|nr:hypothetical protein [Bacteroidota bacterium]
MKKLILSAALATAMIGANAQDMMSKKGTPILPEASDWSIGFDAAPLLGYFGNLFNNTVDNSVSAAYQKNMTLVGKMMKDENTAFQAKLRIGFGSASTDNLVNQDGSTATPVPTVTDTRKVSSMNFTVGAGIQKFRGKGRLKGFYGAEAGIGLGSGKHLTHMVMRFLLLTLDLQRLLILITKFQAVLVHVQLKAKTVQHSVSTFAVSSELNISSLQKCLSVLNTVGDLAFHLLVKANLLLKLGTA